VLAPWLTNLAGRGVALVASAGNDANNADQTLTWLNTSTPRCNGGTNKPLVVVGNVDYTGTRRTTSNYIDLNRAGILSIYAPGTNLLCANAMSTIPYGPSTGTSMATPIVAAVMAYLLTNITLRNQLTKNGANPGNMPFALKQEIVARSIAAKGLQWPIDSGYYVTRLGTNESIPCLAGAQSNAGVGVPSPGPAVLGPTTSLTTTYTLSVSTSVVTLPVVTSTTTTTTTATTTTTTSSHTNLEHQRLPAIPVLERQRLPAIPV
jgi:subtilisin family serine protease